MKNHPIKTEEGVVWVSRSMAAIAYVYQIIDGHLCVLANKRGNGLPNKVGKWNCPSGFLDYGETLEEAACREVWEETGIKISPDKLELVEVDSNPSRDSQNVLIRYKTRIIENDVTDITDEHSEPNEIADIQWIPLSKLDDYEWVSEKHKECIKKYSGCKLYH